MLQAVNIDLFNPLVPKAHNSECKNLLFPLQIKPAKVNSKLNWRIFTSFTLGINGLSYFAQTCQNWQLAIWQDEAHPTDLNSGGQDKVEKDVPGEVDRVEGEAVVAEVHHEPVEGHDQGHGEQGDGGQQVEDRRSRWRRPFRGRRRRRRRPRGEGVLCNVASGPTVKFADHLYDLRM